MTLRVCLLGCGFVADLYMRSLRAMDAIVVAGVWDQDRRRLNHFCNSWGVPSAASLEALLKEDALILNLTNPHAHYETTKACLETGRSVYSEKPLAMDMAEALELHGLAQAKGLELTSAPCSVLGEAAQTMGHAFATWHSRHAARDLCRA